MDAPLARHGFEPVDIKSLRPHYAQTLLHWLTRLEARVPDRQPLLA